MQNILVEGSLYRGINLRNPGKNTLGQEHTAARNSIFHPK